MNYSIEDRRSIQVFLIEKARSDPRISDAALVGSESVGKSDRWSDIDLTFGVSDNIDLKELMADWSAVLEKEFRTEQLFDLVYEQSVYRVFLTPECLQIDLSFTPTSYFGAITENFKLIFGKEKERAKKKLPEAQIVYGYFVLYTLKSRSALERGRLWQSLGFLEAGREQLLKLACLKYQLNPFDGRGYDDLPDHLKAEVAQGLVADLNVNFLMNALSKTVDSGIQLTEDLPGLKPVLSKQLKAIGSNIIEHSKSKD